MKQQFFVQSREDCVQVKHINTLGESRWHYLAFDEAKALAYDLLAASKLEYDLDGYTELK